MITWLRWQFVVPRLALCAVVVLAAQFVLGFAARSVARREAGVLFGTPVEVAHAHVSLSNGRVTLSGVRALDPNSGRELVADSCELKLAGGPLFQKHIVVERARVCGARIENVAADNQTAKHDDCANHATAKWFCDSCVEKAAARLTGLCGSLHQDFSSELESVKLTKKLRDQLPAEIAKLDKRAVEFDRHASELEKAIATAHSNSLRHDSFLNDLPARLVALREEAEKLNADFESLPQKLDDERRAIVAARITDDKTSHGRTRVEPIDPSLVNAYLLREQVAQSLNELIACLQEIRQLVPACGSRSSRPARGENFLFAGVQPMPEVLVRRFEVQAQARALGQPFELRGVVTGWSTAPGLSAEPIQVRLSGTGTAPIEVRATIDRTGGRVRDELIVDCRELQLNQQSLGHADRLQLTLAPSPASLSVSIRVEGNKLHGDVQLVQKDLKLAPVLGDGLDGKEMEAPLRATLADVNSLATRVSLDGTLDKPSGTLWSNLGPAVAEAIQRAGEREEEKHSKAVLAAAHKKIDEQLAGLDRQVADAQASIAGRIAAMPARLDTIARTQSRSERLDAEQLGRRLPSNSILR